MNLYPAQHGFAIGRRRPGRYVAAVAVLHLALFWVVTRPVHHSAGQDRRVWIQLLQPRQAPVVPAPQPVATLPAPARPAPPRPAPARAPDLANLPAPPAAPAPALPSEPAPAPVPAPAPAPATETLAQQALKAVGAIDRQLRAEHPQEFVAPPDTAQTRLAKGFAEAHAAVKPKWFEAARIELWSAPNDPKRIYRVITATGEYCIYLPDKGNMTLNLSARSGYAGFGGGTAAPCPIRF